MGNFFIAVGGTGQMVAVAYWKLQQLIPWCKPAEMYYMDRDPITNLTAIIPSIKDIDPLPEGITSDTDFCDYFYDPANPELTSNILNCLFTGEEQRTPIHTGMYGRPPVGASMIKARFLATAADSGRADQDSFADLVNTLNDGNRHIVCICGSAKGGTGAGGVPSTAQYIDQKLQVGGNRANVRIYVFYFLKHFTLTLPGGEGNGPSIINDQIRRNAESGMCYLKDEIAKGVDGTLLLGLDSAPQRNYQEVGVQSEQCEFLHLLAAVQLQRVFLGEEFPGNLCGYAIPEGGLPLNNLTVRLPNNNQVGLGNLLKLNEAVAELLLLFKKLIDPLPGFSFVSALPRNFEKILSRLERDLSRNKEDICNDIATSLESTVEKLTALYNWFVMDDGLLPRAKSNNFLNFNKSDIKITSGKYERLKGHPMDFIRKWCDKMGDVRIIQKDDYAKELCNKLKDAVYKCLDEELFGKTFL